MGLIDEIDEEIKSLDAKAAYIERDLMHQANANTREAGRTLALARTNIQQARMWLEETVARLLEAGLE